MSSKLKAEFLPAEEIHFFGLYPNKPTMAGHSGKSREGAGKCGVPHPSFLLLDCWVIEWRRISPPANLPVYQAVQGHALRQKPNTNIYNNKSMENL